MPLSKNYLPECFFSVLMIPYSSVRVCLDLSCGLNEHAGKHRTCLSMMHTHVLLYFLWKEEYLKFGPRISLKGTQFLKPSSWKSIAYPCALIHLKLTWGGTPFPGDYKHSSIRVCFQVQVGWWRQCYAERKLQIKS